jgi:hypothetical protein
MKTKSIGRIAGLVFAADSLLSQLHPEHRLKTRFCLPSRYHSHVAQSMTAAQARDLYLGKSGDVQITYSTVNTTLPDMPQGRRNILQPKAGKESRTILYDKDKLKLIAASEIAGEKAFMILAQNTPSLIPGARDIIPAVREILCAGSCGAVAQLIETSGRCSSGAYSFVYYRKRSLVEYSDDELRTVEFRQAAGTLDPSWIAFYARLCVHLCERAIRDRRHGYMALVRTCALAEEDSSKYDIFDFMHELGLGEYADYVEDRVVRDQSTLDSLDIFTRI